MEHLCDVAAAEFLMPTDLFGRDLGRMGFSGAVVHPLNFELALRDFNTVLGIYHSALRHMVVDLPFEPGDGLIDELRERLGADGD